MIVDYYSKYPVVKLLQDNSAESLIEAFSEIVALFGIPNKLITDCGTNYMSDRFQLFCQKLGITHTPISSEHKQANDLTERNIGTLKD